MTTISRTTRTTRIAVGVLAVAFFAGCAPVGGTGADPDADGGDSGDLGQSHCAVGTWQLDVPDYSAQSEAFVLSLGLPIEGFAMTGAGTIQFTEDGLVATDIGLTTTGTIVAGGTRTPINTPSSYTGSGDWSSDATGETINLSNWANVPDPSVVVDPAAPPIPAIDYTDIPSVSVQCSADTLVLQGPGAPLSAVWHR